MTSDMKGAINSQNIKDCLDRALERVKNHVETPGMYHTNCKACGQALLMPCWIKAETCPICDPDSYKTPPPSKV